MSALEQIRQTVTVDIDQLDPELAGRLGPFCDMSQSPRRSYCASIALMAVASNQALIANVVTTQPNSEIVLRCMARARQECQTMEEAADRVIDLLVRPVCPT